MPKLDQPTGYPQFGRDHRYRPGKLTGLVRVDKRVDEPDERGGERQSNRMRIWPGGRLQEGKGREEGEGGGDGDGVGGRVEVDPSFELCQKSRLDH